MKNKLTSILDVDAMDIERIYALADVVKKAPEGFQNALKGKMFGLIFEKPSTRTWISFETGIFSLGGGSIYLGPQDLQLGQREEIRDVARVLDRYLGGVVLRTFSHKSILEFSKYFQKPVVNGLSDTEHPCQALADYFTIHEKFSDLKKPVVCFVGDGNNVLNSLILLAAKLGGTFYYVTPKKHQPPKMILKKAETLAKKTGARIKSFSEPEKAVQGADVVYTDVWVSMGEETNRSIKIKAFDGMQVNSKLLEHAKKNAYIMHCLPAHRGEEITDKVLESKNSIVFDQAENRLHVQKAILLHLCGASD